MTHDCDRCDAEFDAERDLLEHTLDAHGDDLSSHEADETKRRLNRLSAEGNGGGLPVPRTALYGLGALAVLAALGYGLVATGTVSFSTGADQQTGGTAAIGEPIHWHADYRITVCGEDRVLENGPLLAHTHGQHTFHLEGTRTRQEQATLDWIVDQLGGDLTNTSILGYEEPEPCPGSNDSGELTIRANGQEIEDPSAYIVRDGDTIEITYG